MRFDLKQSGTKADVVARSGFPVWLTWMGWLALPGGGMLLARMIYEQTYLTWSEGPQMLGFALWHVYAGYALLGYVCLFLCFVSLLVGLV